jgi:hypothetical protein
MSVEGEPTETPNRAKAEDVHIAAPDAPMITRYEPGFRRIYAQGTIVHNEDADPSVVRIAFWSSRQKDLEMDDGEKKVKATGYALEGETVISWTAAEKLHFLLGKWLKEHRPKGN